MPEGRLTILRRRYPLNKNIRIGYLTYFSDQNTRIFYSPTKLCPSPFTDVLFSNKIFLPPLVCSFALLKFYSDYRTTGLQIQIQSKITRTPPLAALITTQTGIFLLTLFAILFAARKYSMSDTWRKSHQNHRLRSGTQIRSRKKATSFIRYPWICRTGSRELRLDRIWHRYVVCRRYLLCFVSIIIRWIKYRLTLSLVCVNYKNFV